MNDIHEPDPRFVENLEGMLASARRRREAFGPVRADSQKRRSLKMFAIILCSVLSGVVATATTTHFQDVAQGKLLLTQADTRIQLADSRLEYTRRELRAIKERIELGVVSSLEGTQIAGEVERLEIARQVLDLDREEIRASHEPVLNDLSAPLVGGRDFVTERLRLEIKSLQTAAKAIQAEAERIQRQIDVGVAASEEMNSYRQKLDGIARSTDEINRKIELRARFFRGEIPAEKVDLLALVTEAEKKVEAAKANAAVARGERDLAEKRFQVGLISSPEMERLRFAVESAEANAKLALLELEILQANLNK